MIGPEGDPPNVAIPIDVAEVNGRTFLNNVSLGVYGDTARRSSRAIVTAVLEMERTAHDLGVASRRRTQA